MRFVAIALLVVGCGSSSKSKTPEQPEYDVEDPKTKAERLAREKREEEINAKKPADPYELRDSQALATTERCGQGPYQIKTEGLHAKYGERVKVYACGARALRGNYRMTQTRKYGEPDSFERTFGWDGTDSNKACKGSTPVAVVTKGSGTSTSSTAGGSGPATTGGPTASAPTKLEHVQLVTAAAPPKGCTKTYISEYGWETSGPYPALDGAVTIDIWSDEPMDLDGVVFVIERHAVVSTMTPDAWTAYNAAYDAWYKEYRAFRDELLATGVSRIVDDSVKTPPPPAARAETPPPKPSKNARWIPGYWHYEDAKFHWIAGLWDVPPEDIEKELTVQAPTPPPVTPPQTVRDEPVEPRPTQTAVWTPGSWYWDGRAYIWIAGAWRIPPSPQQTWQPPTWTIRTGRAIYRPGGWRIRIGR